MSSTSHSIEPFYDVNLNQEQVFAMCRQYRILPQHYRCFWRLVARCEINSDDFGRRIVFQRNYKRLTDKILAIVDGVA
jgi:hypothetical protein